MRLLTVFLVYFTVAAAAPKDLDVAQRIVGGENVPIAQWPQVANVLFTWNSAIFEHFCGGTIISENTVLTAAHCIYYHPANRFRIRVGSALASSGGVSINVAGLIPHPSYNVITEDYDVGLIRTATNITFTPQVQAACIADTSYNLDDNEIVRAVGWGANWYGGSRSEQLREVQIWTINQEDCARRYNLESIFITDNMLCAGWLDVGGRGQCNGDGGSPLFHNDIVVGVYSFSINCGTRFYPGVNTRVSEVSEWITENM